MGLTPEKVIGGWSAKAYRRALNLYPPIRMTGARIKRISDDFRHWEVELRLRWSNWNYVGTIFGGALYGSADPHYMLAWMRILGPEYIVWDKAANIRFKEPGKGRLRAHIDIDDSEIEEVKRLCEENWSVDRTYPFEWIDEEGVVVAEIEKVLYFRKKRPDASRKG